MERGCPNGFAGAASACIWRGWRWHTVSCALD